MAMVTSKTRPCIQIIVQIKRLFIIINHCPTKSTSMPLKLAANLSMMFAEVPTLAERYECAKDAGFKYVTATFPYAEDAGTLAKARRKAGLEQVLINGWPGICIVFFFLNYQVFFEVKSFQYFPEFLAESNLS